MRRAKLVIYTKGVLPSLRARTSPHFTAFHRARNSVMKKWLAVVVFAGLLSGCSDNANQGGSADSTDSTRVKEVRSGNGRIYDRGGGPITPISQPSQSAQSTSEVVNPKPDNSGAGTISTNKPAH